MALNPLLYTRSWLSTGSPTTALATALALGGPFPANAKHDCILVHAPNTVHNCETISLSFRVEVMNNCGKIMDHNGNDCSRLGK